MKRMGVAESAILFRFHTIRMRFLILCQIVITALALRACECDLGTHFVSPPINAITKRAKKNSPKSFQLVHYIIIIFLRQRYF